MLQPGTYLRTANQTTSFASGGINLTVALKVYENQGGFNGFKVWDPALPDAFQQIDGFTLGKEYQVSLSQPANVPAIEGTQGGGGNTLPSTLV